MKVICLHATFSVSDVIGPPSSAFFVSRLALLLQSDIQVASVPVFLCLWVLTLTGFSIYCALTIAAWSELLGPFSLVAFCCAGPGSQDPLHRVSLTLCLETSLTSLRGDDK